MAVQAVSINYRDVMIYRGEYPAPADVAVIPCSDGAGVVLEVGSAVSGAFARGDPVVGAFFPQWQDGPPTRTRVAVSVGCSLDGWLAEEVIMPSDAIVHIPPGVSIETAACAPCAGVTAWVSIVEMARLGSGQTVLIQGTGGVSMWAAQLAKAMGLTVVLITSDEAKAAHLTDTNSSFEIINYRKHPNWSNEVLRLTNGLGADLVLELGGNATVRESLRAVAFGGHIAVIGGLGGWKYENVEYLELITKSITVHGVYVGSTRSLADLLGFVSDQSIAPYVSDRFAYQDARSAFLAVEAGGHVGKVIINVG